MMKDVAQISVIGNPFQVVIPHRHNVISCFSALITSCFVILNKPVFGHFQATSTKSAISSSSHKFKF